MEASFWPFGENIYFCSLMLPQEARIFTSQSAFPLECGKSLPGIEIAYHSYGKLNDKKDNVVWVCHAFTANSDVFDWWKGLFGEECLFNPEDHFIICANKIGSCYGSTGPLSINPETGLPWYHDFPFISMRDMVNAHELLRQHLGIDRIKVLIGGSTGGHQALEWAILKPGLAEYIVPIITHAKSSPWSIAYSESQRLAIEADQTWKENSPDAGLHGMLVARSIALISYRNYETYCKLQQESTEEKLTAFRAMSYQRYQGEKLLKRFNAFSYMCLLNALDSHNVGRGRGGVKKALSGIRSKALVIGISGDGLFPVSEQKILAELIPGAAYCEIDSLYGHDGFLLETQKLAEVIGEFVD